MWEDMPAAKLSVICCSATGTLHAMAQRAAAEEKAGAQVRLRQVPEIAGPERIASMDVWSAHVTATEDEPKASTEDLVRADAVLLGTPTRCGNVAAQLEQYLDATGGAWAAGLPADEVCAGFTATQTAHGGQESTLPALDSSIYHFGGILVPPGCTDPLKFADGDPYGVAHVTGVGDDAPLSEVEHAALEHLASRVVQIAGHLLAGRNAVA